VVHICNSIGLKSFFIFYNPTVRQATFSMCANAIRFYFCCVTDVDLVVFDVGFFIERSIRKALFASQAESVRLG
jgi:hypothetical protein